jgi:hypothetical protein
LNELENLHLIDRIWQRFRDVRDAREKLGVGVHEAVSYGGPMIEAMIEIADAGLFLGVAREEFGIESHDRFSDGLPFHLAASILGWAGLQASLVCVRACIADILVAVGLGEEQAQADTACNR